MNDSTFSEEDLKAASRAFRKEISRLRNTDFQDGTANVERLLNLIEEDKVLNDLIRDTAENHPIDVEEVVESREFGQSYPDFIDSDEEIAFVYQLLKYGAENFRRFGRFCEGLTRNRRTSDDVAKFQKDVIMPFFREVESRIGSRIPEPDSNQTAAVNVKGEGNLVNIGQGSAQAEATQIQIDYGLASEQVEALLDVIQESNESSDAMEECEDVLLELQEEFESDEPDEGRLKDLFGQLRTFTENGLMTYQAAMLLGKLCETGGELGLVPV